MENKFNRKSFKTFTNRPLLCMQTSLLEHSNIPINKTNKTHFNCLDFPFDGNFTNVKEDNEKVTCYIETNFGIYECHCFRPKDFDIEISNEDEI